MVRDLGLKEQIVEKAQELIKEGQGPFSLAVIDVDNFANINKTYGYSIGDEVIKKITSILCQNVSDFDCITRRGDEYCLLLINKGSERSFIELEELRRYISDNIFNFNYEDRSENIYITISCGIASYPRDAKNYVELSRVADSALFRAKKLGKNKVCLSEVESMVLKSSYFTKTQVDRLSSLAKLIEKTEAFLLREALDDLFKKYSQ
ncbi:UNVERIFIED_CONTAM: diguanylate cyclase (GGDEF)-like protein [Acetivibrio alkalicellulosi]